MSTAKPNLFHALKHATSNEETEEQQSQTRKFPAHPQPNVKKSERIGKGKNIVNEPALDIKKLKEAKQTLLKNKEADLDHPHQLDRHSGTGISAYDKREKRGGSGVYNWGSTDLREDFENPQNENRDLTAIEGDEENNEENTLTFEEYSQKNGQGKMCQQVNEAKAKITDEQLLQAIGKASALQSRKDRDLDDRTETHSKKPREKQSLRTKPDHAKLLGIMSSGTQQEEGSTQKDAARSLRPQNKKEIMPVNMEDDKSFPKLG